MGELDKKQKVYFEDPRKFADVWNALVYEGEQVVSWEGLRECSPVLVHAEGEGAEERTPDVCMKETADGEMLAILILENQKEVDYGMAARVFLEEAMAYERQARGIRRRNRELYEKTKNAGRLGAYLYWFGKEDRLRPVSTLVLYWNDKEWDGARSLHELIDFSGAEGMRGLVPEFRLHLYDMSKVEHQERFRTDVGTLVGLYQRRGDKEAFREFGNRAEAEGGRKLDKLGLEVLGMLVSSKRLMKLLETKKEKEELTMCKAIEDIYEEGREKGIREGREEMCKAIDDIYEEGREKGIREGREAGREDERKNTQREAARADAAESRAETAESENMRLKKLLDMAGIAY